IFLPLPAYRLPDRYLLGPQQRYRRSLRQPYSSVWSARSSFPDFSESPGRAAPRRGYRPEPALPLSHPQLGVLLRFFLSTLYGVSVILLRNPYPSLVSYKIYFFLLSGKQLFTAIIAYISGLVNHFSLFRPHSPAFHRPTRFPSRSVSSL